MTASAPKPESLEAKFKLMTILPYDKRAKRKHILVYGFILDWYHDKYGNALASVRHVGATIKERDPFGVGLYTGDIHSALTDLVAWGYLTQEKGTGRKASRYIPDWSKCSSVQKNPNTTEDEISVRENPNTDVRETPNANADSIQKTPNEDPLTGPGHKTGPQVMGNKFDAAPVAPPAVGLEATAAGPASGDGFSDFWKAWPRKHGIKKAKAEWKKITHDVDIIIEVARTWAEHYEKHGTEKKWIPEPANWLAGERWDEDLPLIHGDAKGAAIAKAKANAPAKKPEPVADNDNSEYEDDIPDFLRGSPSLWPVGEYYGEFIENGVVCDGGDIIADLLFHVNTPGEHFGKRLRHRFFPQCFIKSAQEEGQKYLSDICAAVGLGSVDDLDDVMFKPVRVKADGRALTYSKIEEAAA